MIGRVILSNSPILSQNSQPIIAFLSLSWFQEISMLCLACLLVTLHVLGSGISIWELDLVVCNNGLFRHFLSVILVKQPISEEMTASFTHVSNIFKVHVVLFPNCQWPCRFEFPNFQTFHASHSKKICRKMWAQQPFGLRFVEAKHPSLRIDLGSSTWRRGFWLRFSGRLKL